MSTGKFPERLSAQYEPPPPAGDDPPHVAALGSSQIEPAGGGSPTDPGACRSLTPRYLEEMLALGEPDEIADSVGMGLVEMAALPAKNRDALIRQKPIEVMSLLQRHGLADLAFSFFPANAIITIWSALYGFDPAPFLDLPPDDGLQAFFERADGPVIFLRSLPFETAAAIVLSTVQFGNFIEAARVAGVQPPLLN